MGRVARLRGHSGARRSASDRSGKAATSDAYCDEVCRTVADAGVAITELSTHLQGQLVAVHPAYDTLFDGFAAPHVRGDPAARRNGRSSN